MAEDQVYDEGERSEGLVILLRALAARIDALKADQDLLSAGPELLKLMGDVRSELFHHEVRSTYDTPQVAESRRVVEEAKEQVDHLNLPGDNGFEIEDLEETPPWLE
ncbi:MAG: hypothetical protein IIA27_04970 [Gemmatimonadetes bacterium]|nr:hypothetical protein [Gemmatimonadota bacterium]